MAAVYNRLNGLPAYSGIVAQKVQLRRHLLAEARRHGILWPKKHKRELRFTTRRRIVSVFIDNQAPP